MSVHRRSRTTVHPTTPATTTRTTSTRPTSTGPANGCRVRTRHVTAVLASTLIAAAAGALAAPTAGATPLGAGAPPAGAVRAAGAIGTTAAIGADGEETGGRLNLVLDSSGSMAEPADGGVTKILAAKSALHAVVAKVPAGVEVGMRVYGARGKASGDACTDSQAVVPIGTADAAQRSRLNSAITSYQPVGETPISYGLQQAAKDLGATGRRTILLVSDGEETCKADPCATAKAIAATGVDVKIDVVGLKVNAAARTQLQCIAESGNGTYYDADSAAELTSSLQVSSVRAFRPFRLTGTPVKGAVGSTELPVIGAGQYLDTLPASSEPRRYTIRKAAGSTLRVSATLFIDARGKGGFDSSTLKLSAPDGSQCAIGSSAGLSQLGESASAVTALADGKDIFGGNFGDACLDATEVTLTVQRGSYGDSLSGDEATRFELLVSEEGAVASTAGLPYAAGKPAAVTLAQVGRPVAGAGGTSFSDAATVTPAGLTDSIRPGEVLVYRVPVRFGQQPAFRVDIGAADATGQDQLGIVGRNITYQLRNPMRAEVSSTTATYRGGYGDSRYLLYDGGPATGSATGPSVRYLNRTSPASNSAAQEGYYYLFVNLTRSSNDTKEFSVPITVRGAALGTPSGAPREAAVAAPVTPGSAPDPVVEPTAGESQDAATPTATPTDTTGPSGAVSTPAPATPSDTTSPVTTPSAGTTSPAAAADAAAADGGSDSQADASLSQPASGSSPLRTVAVSTAAVVVIAGLAVLAIALLRRPRHDS